MLRLVPPADPISRVSATRVRVHAGTPLWRINALLEERWGLALANLGAIANQTIGGATATNTHGTGPTTGLSGFVAALTIVLANGTVLDASPDANSRVFAAARTGYGALGVVTWLELAVVPLWRMERIQSSWDLDALRAALPALRAQFARVEWWWTPYNKASAVLLVRANVPLTTPVTGCWGSAPYATPVTPPPAGMASWPPGTSACIDVSYKVLTGTGDDFNTYTEMEMMVDDRNGTALLSDFIAFQDSVRAQWNASVGIHTGVRYVVGDDIPLSQFYGRNTTVCSMVVYGPSKTQAADAATVSLFHRGLQALAIPYGARPHPGKNQ